MIKMMEVVVKTVVVKTVVVKTVVVQTVVVKTVVVQTVEFRSTVLMIKMMEVVCFDIVSQHIFILVIFYVPSLCFESTSCETRSIALIFKMKEVKFGLEFHLVFECALI